MPVTPVLGDVRFSAKDVIESMDQIFASFELPELEIRARSSRRSVHLTIVVCGELDIASAPPLSAHLGELIREGDRVLLDLEQVPFCGAIGVQLLIDLRNLAHQRDAELLLRNPSRSVCRVLDVTRLTSQFTIQQHPRGT